MLRTLQQLCEKEGFDLVDPIHTKWYNDLIEEEGHVERGILKKIPVSPTISETDTNNENCDSSLCEYNAVLIGNSKSIWPKFMEWLLLRCEREVENEKNGKGRDRDEIMDQVLNDNPFDTFVTDTLLNVFQSCCNNNEEGDTNCIGSSSSSSSLPSPLISYEIFWSNGKRQQIQVDTTTAESARESAKIDGEYHCYAARKNDDNDDDDDDDDDDEDTSFLVSMQRVAKVTGNYWHDEEGTKLCVHPKFGTWKAFRAVVVFHTATVAVAVSSSNPSGNGNGNHAHAHAHAHTDAVPEVPAMCPCPVIAEEIQMAKEVMDYAIKASAGETNIDYGRGRGTTDTDTDTDADADTQSKCDAWSKNLCKYLHGTVTGGSDWSKVSPSMRPWIQLRDCISVGREEYKYDDAQILYHYTKDPEILKNELEKFQSTK